MKPILVMLGALLFASHAMAVKLSAFTDVDTLIARSNDIVIVQCTSVPKGGATGYDDGLYPMKTNILKVLKGSRNTGPLSIAAIYPLTEGKNYLLCNSGGKAFDADFLAVAELSVVELPTAFDFADLDKKPLREQVLTIFFARRTAAHHLLGDLEAEDTLLDSALEHESMFPDADAAIGHLKTWHDLRTWWDDYKNQDDGGPAEGVSDFVAQTLAKHWESLPALAHEVALNRQFHAFVILRHIGTTADWDDLRAIVKNCDEACPPAHQALCEEIRKEAAAALKEVAQLNESKPPFEKSSGH